MKPNIGKLNLGVGLLVLGGFMLYGFYLIYARDFAPDKEIWIAGNAVAPHFEARLAHVHGNLFALLNIVFGYLLLKLPIEAKAAKWISTLTLVGILMPLGILGELYLSLPPVFVLLGAASIISATILFGVKTLQLKMMN
jgi:hypothetical protein